ncbi:MAG: glycoside hydrolase family 3 N-terminal domain-containing protein [Chloroflexia bacterium]
MRKNYTRRQLLAMGAGAAIGLSGILSKTSDAWVGDLMPTNLDTPPVELIVVPPMPETISFKIAQMLMVGFYGTVLTEATPIWDAIRNYRIGGVLLFDNPDPSIGNIESPEQLKTLTTSLQELTPIPLLIATDQEGGSVARLKPRNGFPSMPSQQYLGNLNDPTATRRYANSTAFVLKDHGINLNLAPVVDLNTNPSNPVIGSLGRSFSADPSIVTSQSASVLSAHADQGVYCALKHFPGHGSSRADSHAGFVDVTNTWSRTELEPYKQLIASGQCNIIMTAHIFNANLDPNLPATLSYPTITGLLREELGYDGVIMTDDMQMGAITSYYSFDKAIELTIKAGVDIITIGSNLLYGPTTVKRAIGIITGLLERGEITYDRIDASYRRIKRLKSTLY